MYVSSAVRIGVALTVLFVAGLDPCLIAADAQRFPFEVREAAGIRRRNDVITVRADKPEIVDHKGGFRILSDDKPAPAQVRLVEWPGEPKELVIDFVDHFRPLESRSYSLELTAEPTTGEPTDGLTLTETDDAFRIDSSGVVSWTIRKDLAGLLDFSWKGTDYIAENSRGLFFQAAGDIHQLSDRSPTRAAVERSGPIAVGLRFDYDDWPTGTRSTVLLEFPRTKSWIHATWIIDGDVASLVQQSAELKLRLDGPEALIDFGAGDFVYTTVTKQDVAVLHAGPRVGPAVPWSVSRGGPAEGALQEIVTSPKDIPTLRVPGWAHVMDDKLCTALAIASFGETAPDQILVGGDGRLMWGRSDSDDTRAGVRQLEFWLHFVTMPVHIGARTSPRSMQEPLQVQWIAK